MNAIAQRKSHLVGCGWFWAWALVGAAFGFGVSTFGVFTVPLALIAVVFMTRRRPIRGAFGLSTGAGAVLLLIAYIQRSGEYYNPIHWLIPGLILFTAGLVGHAWMSAPGDD
jgi:hypothetical protein